MPLDPHIRSALNVLASLERPPISAGTPQSARESFHRLTVRWRPPETLTPVGSVEESAVEGAAGPLRARIYRPDAAGASAPPTLPTVVFFHGGGFVIGDVETHDKQARTICSGTGAVVVSVDYRLAPEAPFPAAVDDTWAAARSVAGSIDRYGGDAGRLGVAGDSAGANLAAVVALLARDAGGPRLAGQLLIYPVTDGQARFPSATENAEGYFLTLDEMVWFHDHYLGDRAELVDDWRYAPLAAPDKRGLAPAVIVVAEYDPLRDEGLAYADALSEAGVPVEVRRYETLTHGFFDMAFFPAAAAAMEETCALFAKVLGTGPDAPAD